MLTTIKLYAQNLQKKNFRKKTRGIEGGATVVSPPHVLKGVDKLWLSLLWLRSTKKIKNELKIPPN